MMPALQHRAVLAAHGLALGDALGATASQHRTIRDPWVRSMLRDGPAELDRLRVLRPVVPFVLTATGASPLAATDDAEAFAVAARVLLEVGTEAGADDLFEAWRAIMGAPDVWTGTAQRSALLNGELGLLPPVTGRDNPAFYDDSALPGAVAMGIAVADPREASAAARRMATLTHDGVGVVAAGLIGGLVSSLLSGTPLPDALDTSLAEAAADDWLADGLRDALALIADSPSPFAAIPGLIARFAPRNYSHPGTVAETLPLAVAILRATDGDHERALPLAMSIARHQDSLPALVGALCGALGSEVDGSAVDLLQGVTVPALAGTSLRDLAEELAGRR